VQLALVILCSIESASLWDSYGPIDYCFARNSRSGGTASQETPNRSCGRSPDAIITGDTTAETREERCALVVSRLGGRPGAQRGPACGRRASIVTTPGAGLGEFVAAGPGVQRANRRATHRGRGWPRYGSVTASSPLDSDSAILDPVGVLLPPRPGPGLADLSGADLWAASASAITAPHSASAMAVASGYIPGDPGCAPFRRSWPTLAPTTTLAGMVMRD